MAKELPYSVVYGKIPDLLKKIADAKVPDSVTHAFLRDTLGFKSVNDRNLIGLLKSLGILDSSGKPTARYRELKNETSRKSAIAAGIREAYAPLFEANENAHTLSSEGLKGLIAQVAGTDVDMTKRINYTLNALIKEADFSPVSSNLKKDLKQEKHQDAQVEETPNNAGKLNTEFHFNIQVHLPNNGSEETYLNIFNALRETFR